MNRRMAASKQCFHRILKPHKSFKTTHLRRLSAAPESPPPPPDAEPPQSAVTQIVNQLKSTDDWTTATDLHQQLVSLDPRVLLKITRQLGTSIKALKFFHFINENPPPSLSPLSLYSSFQAVLELAIREEASSCLSIVDLLNLSKELKVSLTPNAAILLIKYFFRVKKAQDAVLLYNELDPDVKNTNVKNVLLDVLLKSDQFNDARQLLDEMLEPDAKFPPNETTLNIVFPVLLRLYWGNEIEKFLGLIPKFGTHHVFPSDVWLTRLITKLCRSYRVDKAWDVLYELMKLHKVGTEPCNMLLLGLGKERNYKRINLFMKEMKENHIQPDIVTFGMLMNYLCKSRMANEALDLFKKMNEGSDGVCVKPDVIIYNTLIDGLCKVGRQEEGLALMKQMKSEDDCLPNTVTFNCLIDGFCKSGDIERSTELFDQMTKEGVKPNVVTVNTLIDGMCKHGRISAAMEFFRQMQEEKGVKGNTVTYSVLISAFCNVNNIEKAMSLFDEMESLCSPDAIVYYSLISGLTLARRLDDAMLIASKMKKAGFKLDLVSYNTLIGGFCRKKRLDKAVEILKEMEETGVKPDVVTYNTLISYFSRIGDFESANKFVKRMVNDGNAPTIVTFGALIHAYCLSGNLDEAMNIFKQMANSSKDPPNTVIYNILIDSFCKRGHVERALSLMNEMLEKKVRASTTTFNAIFKGLWDKNKLKEALRVMDQMTEQASDPDYITMEILTSWLSEVGEIDTLKNFVEGYQVSGAGSSIALLASSKGKKKAKL